MMIRIGLIRVMTMKKGMRMRMMIKARMKAMKVKEVVMTRRGRP